MRKERLPEDMYRDSKSSKLYARFKVEGQLIRQSLKTSDVERAKIALRDLKAGCIKTLEQVTAYRWEAACEDWLNTPSKKLQRVKSQPEFSTVNQFNKLFLAKYPDIAIEDVTKDMLLPFLPEQDGTRNRMIGRINAIFSLAVENGNLDKPIKLKKGREPEGVIRWLTKEEWDALYNELPSHLKPAALFSVSTGLRQANVLGLKWRDIDLKRGRMWVQATDTKGGKMITVLLNPTALKVLTDLRKSMPTTHHVFTYTYPISQRRLDRGEKPRVVAFSNIKNAWQDAVARAGLGTVTTTKGADGKLHRKFDSDVHWHVLRHTWASWLLNAGASLEELQGLGGWSANDMRMVMRYSHLADTKLQSAANLWVPYSNSEAEKAEKRAEFVGNEN